MDDKKHTNKKGKGTTARYARRVPKHDETYEYFTVSCSAKRCGTPFCLRSLYNISSSLASCPSYLSGGRELIVNVRKLFPEVGKLLIEMRKSYMNVPKS